MPTTAIFPKYIPISQAAMQFGINPTKLHDLATLGKIEAIQLPNGKLAVNEDMDKKVVAQPLRKEDLPEYQQFAHLAGETTWIGKASRDYDIPQPTISRWTNDELIRVVRNEGQKKILDSQDVAYCAFIYQEFQEEGETRGRRIFDDNGLPYKPKTGPFAE
ncbi:MAG: hypothetical protein U9O54_06990 [Chloroflexota bacterium]|nr:hypothetical protein [Chloroflexota bacterium]